MPDARRAAAIGPSATLLLHCEGGFGDALQFVRYLPLATARAGNTILECPPALHALFARVPNAEMHRGRRPPGRHHLQGQRLPDKDVTRILAQGERRRLPG